MDAVCKSCSSSHLSLGIVKDSRVQILKKRERERKKTFTKTEGMERERERISPLPVLSGGAKMERKREALPPSLLLLGRRRRRLHVGLPTAASSSFVRFHSAGSDALPIHPPAADIVVVVQLHVLCHSLKEKVGGGGSS